MTKTTMKTIIINSACVGGGEGKEVGTTCEASFSNWNKKLITKIKCKLHTEKKNKHSPFST